jgi:hypothetical protein
MTRTLPAALAGALAALCLAAPVASAAKPKLWATVNVCDTTKHPGMMGVRARMPGLHHGGRHQRMFMRFTAEYRAAAGKWQRVDHGQTGWIPAGPATRGYQDRGYNFPLKVPKGASFVFRGRVSFEWRKQHSGRVAKSRVRLTEPGHPTASSDPKHYSRATCRIAGPPASGGS